MDKRITYVVTGGQLSDIESLMDKHQDAVNTKLRDVREAFFTVVRISTTPVVSGSSVTVFTEIEADEGVN